MFRVVFRGCADLRSPAQAVGNRCAPFTDPLHRLLGCTDSRSLASGRRSLVDPWSENEGKAQARRRAFVVETSRNAGPEAGPHRALQPVPPTVRLSTRRVGCPTPT